MHKVALVTGAGSGIGRASAVRFVKQGFAVVVADINAEVGEGTCKLIEETGGEAMFVKADVSQEEDVQQLIDSIDDKYGRLDVCLNNAGIEGDRAVTHKYSTEAFDRVMAVNARSVFLCLKYEIPLMLETAGTEGSIVITSSSAGMCGMPEFCAYSASKHAVIGLARTAAAEYAGKIRINCINPATTDTPMIQRFTEKWPDWQAETNAAYPMGRIATAEEVAEAAVWMATKATFTTGQTLVIDGGLMCR